MFFPYYLMTGKSMSKGVYYELFLQCPADDEPKSCGYAIALNQADQIKRVSHLLSDTSAMLFDEFQSETNHYCADEVQKLISVHTSIARGQGKQVKYLPVYMLSNAVTLINPYYTALGISLRLQPDTKFLRGDGWVLEQGYKNSLLVLAAYENDELLGIIRVVGDGFTIVFIQDILVFPSAQRKGVGTALLKAVLERYPDVRQIELTTDNTPKTVDFYKSLGFSELSEIGCCGFMRC